MPGVPRTTYCQPCKRRRTKCDQKWPTCSSCSRAHITCPGPTQLLKFVNNGNHSAEKANDVELVQSSSGGDTLVLATRPHAKSTARAGSVARSFRLVNTKERPSQTPKSKSQSRPKFVHVAIASSVAPQRTLATITDHVASQLVSILDWPGRQVMVGIHIVKHFPARLSNSVCLRDAATYWCAAWLDYHQGLQTPSLSALSCYGRLLHSLQLALSGPRALSVETLAAATAIQISGMRFYYQLHYSQMDAHLEGIAQLMSARGPPLLDDELDVELAIQNRSLLISRQNSRLRTDFLRTARWDGVMQEANYRPVQFYEEKEGGLPMRGLMDDYDQRWEKWVAVARVIHIDPTFYAKEAISLTEELAECLANIEAGFPKYWHHITRDGAITEIRDPELFVGKKYSIASHTSAVRIFNVLYLQLLITRMLLDFSILYDGTDGPVLDYDLIKSKHREFCIRAWMLMPYLRSKNPLESDEFQVMFFLTFEAADTEEREKVPDMVLYLDSVRRKFGVDRDKIPPKVIALAKFVTGRPHAL